jgi:hypothetical protein
VTVTVGCLLLLSLLIAAPPGGGATTTTAVVVAATATGFDDILAAQVGAFFASVEVAGAAALVEAETA